MDTALRRYLFEKHSVETLRVWYGRLQFFRYVRALGGHANDDDALELAIAYRGEDELCNVLQRLHIPFTRYHLAPAQPVPGKTYPSAGLGAFPSLVQGTRWIKQPGRVTIGKTEAFVWCHPDRVVITADPNGYEVTNDTVAAAELLERELGLDQLDGLSIICSRDTSHCLCPARYPELLAEGKR